MRHSLLRREEGRKKKKKKGKEGGQDDESRKKTNGNHRQRQRQSDLKRDEQQVRLEEGEKLFLTICQIGNRLKNGTVFLEKKNSKELQIQ
jgi:hypothetical protein